jgi:hypothetical protein
MATHARSGWYLCCENGHPVAIFTRDVLPDEMYRHGDLEFIFSETPIMGSQPRCQQCGELIFVCGPVTAIWDDWG